LRHKMEFLNADLVELQPPTDAQLQAYFDANQERFKRPDLFSFQQVYLNPDKLEGDAGQAAVELLASLNTGPAPVVDPGAFGHTTLLPYQLVGVTKREILNTFGPTFANQIVNAPVGRWSGPHESSYGLHLVRVSGRDLGGLPPLTEIRPILERGWYAERRIEADDRFYRAIRARYDIKIRLPADLAGKTLAVR